MSFWIGAKFSGLHSARVDPRRRSANRTSVLRFLRADFELFFKGNLKLGLVSIFKKKKRKKLLKHHHDVIKIFQPVP
jgi:hypothetical protein